MADEADTTAAPPTSGDVATSTPSDSVATDRDQVRENADNTEKRHPDAYVESVDDAARDSGDPYFNEYQSDPDDNRADEGVREPRPIDRPTARLLGVEFNG